MTESISVRLLRLVHDPPEDRWHSFVNRAEDGNVFQSPELARVYKELPSCRTMSYAVEDHGELVAVLSAVVTSYGFEKLPRATSRAVVVGGPIGELSAFPLLLKAFHRDARAVTLCSQIRNLKPPADRSIFEAEGYHWTDHLNYILHLGVGETVLLKTMSKGRRRGIEIAQSSGLRLGTLSGEDLEVTFGLLRDTYQRARVPLASRLVFASAFSNLLSSRILHAYAALQDDDLCAVRLVLEWNGVLSDWYAGSSERGRELHADEWLVWQVLREGIRGGCSTFDFGGAGEPGKGYGPGEFKRRFGGTQINPGRFDSVYHPLAFRAADAAFRLWRGLK